MQEIFKTIGKGMLRPVTAASLVLAFFMLAGCGEEDANAIETEVADVRYQMGEPLIDSTLAVIVASEYGADTLTTAEFRSQVEMVTQQVPQVANDADQTRELRKNIVEDFVLRHALFGEAEQLGVMADTARVEAQLDQIRSRFASEEQFQQALAADALTEDSLRSSISEFVLQQMMIERLAEAAEEPTEEEVTRYSEEQAEQVRAQHILFLTQGLSETQVDSVEERAQMVLDSIQAGADFAELARRYSEDGTAATGGDLGFFSRGQMVEPFSEAAFALPDSGAVTPELVKTRYGYHIIRLTGRRTGEPIDTTRARQMLLQERRQEAVTAGIRELRKNVTVRLNPMIVDADLNEGEDSLGG